MLITLYYNVDNYVRVLCLLCFAMWITLLCVRVVRTVLLFCLCVADSKVSLWYGHICDCIVFGIWYVVTTLSMFLCVFLGWVTTLWVKMGCFLGFGDTFEILECIRVADTTEPFFVFGRNTSVFVANTYITIWDYCNGSAMADQLKIYHNTVLL